eukprot:9280078-Karenia_brevis.AAC.1
MKRWIYLWAAHEIQIVIFWSPGAKIPHPWIYEALWHRDLNCAPMTLRLLVDLVDALRDLCVACLYHCIPN